MAEARTPESMEKQAALEKAAAAAHQVVTREVYIPTFAKVASSYGVPVPASDAELAKLMDMADYLVAKKQAAARVHAGSIDAMYAELSKEAGVAVPASSQIQPLQAAQAMITDDVAGELAKQAIAAIARNAA